MEIGNSGMFRPEMLLPMGLPEDVKVIAWGLSLERQVTVSCHQTAILLIPNSIILFSSNYRPTMIKYGIDNIRDLVGHKINLKMVQDNPICRLDKYE